MRNSTVVSISFYHLNQSVKLLTIDIDVAGSMTDEPIGSLEEIVHANTEADLLHHLVGIFFIDLVLHFIAASLGELVRWDLNEI